MCIISSLPVRGGHADVAQQVERILGKDEVTSSNLVISSIAKTLDPQRIEGFSLLLFLGTISPLGTVLGTV